MIEKDDEDTESISVDVHILDPVSGYVVDELIIPSSDYEKFGDGNGNVFVMRFYENGNTKDSLVAHNLWEEMRQLYEETQYEPAGIDDLIEKNAKF